MINSSPWRVAIAALVVLLCPVVVVSTAAAEAGASHAPNYVMTVWAAEKGLPPGDVFAITQDLEGYLWLGTPTGLLRFDGTRFIPWTPAEGSPPLPGGPVHALVASRDGSLWVGLGGGGGVARIERGRLVRHLAAAGAPTGATAMIEDRRGVIWVAGRRGVFTYADNRWTLVGPDVGYRGGEAFSLLEDRAGQIWVGSAAGVYRRTADAFELVDASATNLQYMAEDETGGIWMTDTYAILKRLATNTPPRHDPAIRLPTSGWRLLEDRRGQLWVAAFGGGLLRVNHAGGPDPVVEVFEYDHRLAGSPRSLFEDREGNIWVGMRGGLLRLSESNFTTAGPLDGLTHDGVRTSAVGSDGSVWIATGHSLNRFSATGRTAYNLSQTMSLHTDRHGVLWASTAQDVGRFINGRLVPLPISDAVGASRVMAITTDSHDTLWMCSALRGVTAWQGATQTAFASPPEILSRSCQSIYTDRFDRVWAGFISGGTAVYERGAFRTFGEKDGLAPGTVLAIIDGANGAVWFSTTSGVSRYQNGRFTSITSANAPVADLVPVLVEDNDGYIWAGVNSGAGVIRFHPREVDKVAANPSHHLEYAFFDESDGMQLGSQTFQSGVGGVRGGDGRVWVATGLGMAIIDPQHLPVARRPSPPRIDLVTADGRTVVPSPDLVLPAGTATLHIEYGTVSLSAASKLRFRYMLEGVDADWIYAGHLREATYNSMQAGEHRFRVATTHDGQWSESALWNFSVAPPFYLTRSFMLLTGFGIPLLLTTAWWLRLRAVRNQYSLVFAERARVSREIHDTLLQSLAAIGIELETIATQLDPAQNPAREGLRRLRRQVGHSLREARESILELRHNTMKPRALVDLLRDLATNTTRTKHVVAEFATHGRPHCLAEDADIQLLRIGQEAVNNAVRHGRPTRVRIALAYESKRVVLSVSDDGCGFTPDEHDPGPASGQHLGLLNMRERAARVRGRLRIVSSPGAGTTIEASMPSSAE